MFFYLKIHKFVTAILCLLIAVYCSAQQQQQQQPVIVKTSVTSAQNTKATIFAAGRTAIVERSFPLTVPITKSNKLYSIIVEHVSSVIQQDSLLLKLDYDKNKATATILDYSVKNVGKQGAKTRELIQEKTEAERKRHTVKCHLNRVQKANEIMEKSISQVAGKGEAVEERLDQYMKKAEENDAKIVDLEEQIKALDQKIASLQMKISEQESTSYSEISINIRIDATEQEDTDLAISLTVLYQVSNVEWTPSYILKIDSSTLSGALEFGTSIIQQTGEDWKNAKLTLSTAKPSSGGSPPTVSPTYVYLKSRYSGTSSIFDDVAVQSSVNRASAQHFAASAPLSLKQSQEKEFSGGLQQPVAWDQANTAHIGNVAHSDLTDIVTFEISQEMNILSTAKHGQAQQATIATIDLKSAVFEHLVVPFKDQQVYMKLTSKNQSKYPLLTGPMNILIDQQLVSRTQLKPMSSSVEGGLILPGKMFETFLGTDKSVTVVSQPWKQVDEEAGSVFTFNKRNSFTKTRELVINNKKSIPINITIIDSIPKPNGADQVQIYLKKPAIHLNELSSIKTSLVEIMNEYMEKTKSSSDKQPHRVISTCYDSKNSLIKSGTECNVKENGGTLVSFDQNFILKQNFELKAKKSKEMTLEYTIDYPIDKNLGFY